jgi:predicted HTH domain antitoxin
MSKKHVTARISEDLYEAIEQLRDEERLDRSTAVAQLLERGVEDWRIDTAIRRYRDGDVSLGRAAEMAGLSLWRFLDILKDRRVEVNYTEADLGTDVAAVRELAE